MKETQKVLGVGKETLRMGARRKNLETLSRVSGLKKSIHPLRLPSILTLGGSHDKQVYQSVFSASSSTVCTISISSSSFCTRIISIRLIRSHASCHLKTRQPNADYFSICITKKEKEKFLNNRGNLKIRELRVEKLEGETFWSA